MSAGDPYCQQHGWGPCACGISGNPLAYGVDWRARAEAAEARVTGLRSDIKVMIETHAECCARLRQHKHNEQMDKAEALNRELAEALRSLHAALTVARDFDPKVDAIGDALAVAAAALAKLDGGDEVTRIAKLEAALRKIEHRSEELTSYAGNAIYNIARAALAQPGLAPAKKRGRKGK